MMIQIFSHFILFFLFMYTKLIDWEAPNDQVRDAPSLDYWDFFVPGPHDHAMVPTPMYMQPMMRGDFLHSNHSHVVHEPIPNFAIRLFNVGYA
jgi:hypothetical protein